MRTLLAIMMAVALLTFGGLSSATFHGHSQGQVTADDGGNGAGG
jgi:hypothetical protein